MKHWLIPVAILAAFAIAANLFVEIVLRVSLLDAVQALVEKPGPGAALVVVLLLTVDIFIPIPSSIIMVLSGVLFGTWIGGALSLAGSLIGNCLGFELMRRYGASLFRRFVHEGQIRRMQPLIEKFGAMAIILSRPLPVAMETISMAAGLLRMARSTFLTASVAGTAPVTFVYAYAGSSSLEVRSTLPALFALVCLPAAVWTAAHWKLRRTGQLGALALLLLAPGQAAAQSPDMMVGRLLGNSKVKAAIEFVREDHGRMNSEAQAFGETENQRAEALLNLLKAHRVPGALRDAAGNVLAVRRGSIGEQLVAVSFALGDEPRGLSVMLSLLRALEAAEIQTTNDILFAATAGRNDQQRFRGLRYLLREGEFRDQVRFFVAVESGSALKVSSAPKTIGSTTVQLALQVIKAFGFEPEYDNEIAENSLTFEMRIPSVTIRNGENNSSSSIRDIQIVLATILAIAGVS